MKLLTGNESFEDMFILLSEGQIYLSASAMSLILKTIAKKKYPDETIQRLADALECESVYYEESKSEVIAQSLFELSSPEINGVLTLDRCEELTKALQSSDSLVK
jgi:hypothetical protein